ncbi:MAG: ferrous iron transport protein B [Lachnospiraceae bacterium]|nr:ferrous iron transport protein B [Lachnospiraceae bacterium]
MAFKIALAGNPNCGKTTLFNDLTGSTQYVGNWPGVTVEKKEGKLKGHKDVIIEDLPGIYSLSPYTMEEVVSRNYLVDEKPDAILNIIDGTNIERNLYLTTQLLEIGIPTVIAVNMMDLVRKNGEKINMKKLAEELGCEVVEMSALKSENSLKAAEMCIEAAKKSKTRDASVPHVYTGPVEHTLGHIEETLEGHCDEVNLRWYAIKAFERDEKAMAKLSLNPEESKEIEGHIRECEKEQDDDSESIITNARYEYINDLVAKAVVKNKKAGELSTSDKIDKVITNRFLAIPIFVFIMWLVYDLAVGSHPWSIGTFGTDWMNDVLFTDIIPPAVSGALEAAKVAPWLESLIVDGIIGGVGTVLGFLPQMAVLFLFVSILEDSGYMARIAFIMDRVFRRFGLSGKSFIPMLVGTGCGVPAIMASRTIEDEKDRKMTIMLATYLPCGAKMEIVGIMTSTFFPGNSIIATSMYFVGLGIIIVAGISLKKVGYFAGDPAPFVMELPAYHVPSVKGVLIHVWERLKAYAIKAGTIIFIVCVIMWALMHISTTGYTDDIEVSLLKYIGQGLSWIFAPLGFGTWQGTVASISAEMAKEQATATLGLLAHAASDGEADVSAAIFKMFNGNAVAGLSFMLFNIFDAPCLVAIATAFREFNSRKWGWITFAFQMGVGYAISLVVYNIGMWATQGVFTFGTVVAIALIVFVLWALFRPAKKRSAAGAVAGA